MYRRLYRQEGGGLGSLNPYDYMRQEVDKYVQDYNTGNQGEVAAKVMPRPVPRSIPQRGSSGLMAIPQAINNLKNKNISDILNIEKITGIDKVNKLASDFYDSTKGDEANLARHAAASRELANRLTPDIPGGKYIGNVLSFGGGVAEELSDLGQRGMSYFPAALEDIKANITGLNYPSGTTPAEIYKDVYGTNNPQDDYGGVQEAIQNQVQTTVSVTTPGYYDPTFKSNIVQYQEQPLTREEFEQTLPEGYRPLNSTYDAYFDTPYDERVETRKGSYSGMPIILSPENANYFQTYFQGPDSQLHTRPEDRVNAFQPVATPISMQNEQQATGFQKVNNEVLKPVQEQQQGLPRLMEIVNEQLNPTPVDPNAPYGYVDYTPPFIGGGLIPPGGFKTIKVPADKDGNPVNPKGIFKATI